MGDRTQGLYKKYDVFRMDKQDLPGCKHESCDLFVLDITHDPLALAPAMGYAHAAEHAGFTQLAADFRAKVIEVLVHHGYSVDQLNVGAPPVFKIKCNGDEIAIEGSQYFTSEVNAWVVAAAHFGARPCEPVAVQRGHIGLKYPFDPSDKSQMLSIQFPGREPLELFVDTDDDDLYEISLSLRRLISIVQPVLCVPVADAPLIHEQVGGYWDTAEKIMAELPMLSDAGEEDDGGDEENTDDDEDKFAIGDRVGILFGERHGEVAVVREVCPSKPDFPGERILLRNEQGPISLPYYPTELSRL